jgi:hypothetical protein
MERSVEIGHEMAELSAAKAGDAWQEAAYSAFCEYAKTHKYFATQEVRLANPEVAAPHDDRSWGSVALRAKRDKVVVADNWVRSKTLTSHGTVITLWASKIYRGEE